MVSKMFEVRDEGTTIPVLAIQLGSDNEQEHWLTQHAGFGRHRSDHESYIIVVAICGGVSGANSDPYGWPRGARTYTEAHRYIEAHFTELEPGAVVDVQFILGETVKPKKSDRFFMRDLIQNELSKYDPEPK